MCTNEAEMVAYMVLLHMRNRSIATTEFLLKVLRERKERGGVGGAELVRLALRARSLFQSGLWRQYGALLHSPHTPFLVACMMRAALLPLQRLGPVCGGHFDLPSEGVLQTPYKREARVCITNTFVISIPGLHPPHNRLYRLHAAMRPARGARFSLAHLARTLTADTASDAAKRSDCCPLTRR